VISGLQRDDGLGNRRTCGLECYLGRVDIGAIEFYSFAATTTIVVCSSGTVPWSKTLDASSEVELSFRPDVDDC